MEKTPPEMSAEMALIRTFEEQKAAEEALARNEMCQRAISLARAGDDVIVWVGTACVAWVYRGLIEDSVPGAKWLNPHSVSIGPDHGRIRLLLEADEGRRRQLTRGAITTQLFDKSAKGALS